MQRKFHLKFCHVEECEDGEKDEKFNSIASLTGTFAEY